MPYAISHLLYALCHTPSCAICNLPDSRYNAFRQRGVAQVVARSVRDAEVDGSSPFAPTPDGNPIAVAVFLFCRLID